MTPRREMFLFRTLMVVMAILFLLFFALLAIASTLTIPTDATLIEVEPVVCGHARGTLSVYDTDGVPSNGGEVHVYQSPDGPLAILTFGPGVDGSFQRAEVQLPGQPVQVFTDGQALRRAYPDPCAIFEARKQTTTLVPVALL